MKEAYELDFGIKLKLKVYSLQGDQKLILPKMSLVPCFVAVHHIRSWVTIGTFFGLPGKEDHLFQVGLSKGLIYIKVHTTRIEAASNFKESMILSSGYINQGGTVCNRLNSCWWQKFIWKFWVLVNIFDGIKSVRFQFI